MTTPEKEFNAKMRALEIWDDGRMIVFPNSDTIELEGFFTLDQLNKINLAFSEYLSEREKT